MSEQLKELRVSNDAKSDPEELRRRIDDEGYLFFKQLINPDNLLELRRQILTTLQEGGWLIAGTDPMGRAASLLLGFLFVANICAQGLFVYLLSTTSLTTSTYNSALVSQYEVAGVEPRRIAIAKLG